MLYAPHPPESAKARAAAVRLTRAEGARESILELIGCGQGESKR